MLSVNKKPPLETWQSARTGVEVLSRSGVQETTEVSRLRTGVIRLEILKNCFMGLISKNGMKDNCLSVMIKLEGK